MKLHLPTENSRWSDFAVEVMVKKVDDNYITYTNGFYYSNISFFSLIANRGLKPLLKKNK